jgi:hypothetical protein
LFLQAIQAQKRVKEVMKSKGGRNGSLPQDKEKQSKAERQLIDIALAEKVIGLQEKGITRSGIADLLMVSPSKISNITQRFYRKGGKICRLVRKHGS